jgi:hypothetical protein
MDKKTQTNCWQYKENGIHRSITLAVCLTLVRKIVETLGLSFRTVNELNKMI